MRAKNRKVRAFTLLEILICLAIISLLTTLLGIKVSDLIGHYRFRSSARLFLTECNHWQIWALTHQCDVDLSLDLTDKGWRLQAASEDPAFCHAPPHLFRGLQEIHWNGKKRDHIFLKVYSTGRIDPAGIIRLQSKEEIAWIDLSFPYRLYDMAPKQRVLEIPVNPSLKSAQPSV